jgi:putative aminopeptidase FrvX
MIRSCFAAALVFAFLSFAIAARAQSAAPSAPAIPGNTEKDLQDFVATPAVSGFESQLGDKIFTELSPLHPTRDNLGNLLVTIGSGSPRRLIVAPFDEPGYIVSGITPDGYLHVQRLPQFVLPPVFNELYGAQPVRVETSAGKWIDGVVAGLSVHLQPGRTDAPKSSEIGNMYIDIGADSAAEARKAGVDNLSPVAINRRLFVLNESAMYAGASVGDRFGPVALIEMLRNLDPSKVKGTLTVAFVVQQWSASRGLQRVLTTNPFDEMVYVGRLLSGGPIAGVDGMRRAPRRDPGSGVLVGQEQTDGNLSGLAADLKQSADANQIPVAADFSGGIVPRSYLELPAMPAKWAHIGIATAWADTPAEVVSSRDLTALEHLLEAYAQGSVPAASAAQPGRMLTASDTRPVAQPPSNTELLRRLTESYGVSEHESLVRGAIQKLLPSWVETETDDSGDLIAHIGNAPASAKNPSIMVVAHMDEIGFVVKSISADGRLEVTGGGGEMAFFLGHPAVVHTPTEDHDAVMELPNGWDDPKFEWPRRRDEEAVRVDVGARTPDEVARLGIKPGDTITVPKAYRPLLGTRANARSFDDRVGDTALISAAWAFGGPLKDRNVTFVFSIGEELGLYGAAATAKRLAAAGHPPDYVFAIDTFVSSDSPLEDKWFADAPIGKGFVIRAVDNSNIVRPDLVDKVVQLAHTAKIPVQFGATGGGNDGSAFVRYGSVDVALGWPLRYSHSPAEVVDTRDVDALARIVAAISRSW